MIEPTGYYASDQGVSDRMLTASTSSTATIRTEKRSHAKAVFALLLIVLAALGVKYAPASAASPVSCSTNYYSNALRTSCSDGSSSVCYDSGQCTYESAADRQRGVSAYEELLRGAGFCNVVQCVKS